MVSQRITIGATALMYAVRDGHVAVVQELLSRNASIELQDNNGWKALQYGRKFPNIVKMLEEKVLQKVGINVLFLFLIIKNIFPPAIMSELMTKYPSFYSDLSSFLAPYGDLLIAKSKNNSIQVQTNNVDYEVTTFDSLAKCIASGNVHGLKMLLDVQNNAANLCDEDSGLPIILYALRYRPLRLEVTQMMIKLFVSSGASLKVVDFLTGMNALHFLLHVRNLFKVIGPFLIE